MRQTRKQMERQSDGVEDVSLPDGDLEADGWNEKLIGFLARAILSRVTARKETTGAGEIRSGGQHAQVVGGFTTSNRERGGRPGFRMSDFPSQQAPEATGCPAREVGSVIDRTAGCGLVLPKFR